MKKRRLCVIYQKIFIRGGINGSIPVSEASIKVFYFQFIFFLALNGANKFRTISLH